ncbi:AMMECR1 domain [Macleaya cordata]|uniref:AMMECR1 domain n=1 Tax=Macleaya cordata TaxID=56857 RepID=A0A200QHP8_MACCD|nr:AMMECR1 domain [Macleaya cordata]
MVSANREMVVFCFDTLVAHYNSEEAPAPAFQEGQHPLFVTWKKVVNGGEPRLRGCIGTLEARTLINGFKDYALTSALRDRRFSPIQPKELPYLECTVSILTDYETALHYLDWEIGTHGMVIEFTDPDYNERLSATYLPEVAEKQGWTKTETIDSLMRKAGYNGVITESLRKQIHLTRYQSTIYTMNYSDYTSYVKMTRGENPLVVGTKPILVRVIFQRLTDIIVAYEFCTVQGVVLAGQIPSCSTEIYGTETGTGKVHSGLVPGKFSTLVSTSSLCSFVAISLRLLVASSLVHSTFSDLIGDGDDTMTFAQTGRNL